MTPNPILALTLFFAGGALIYLGWKYKLWARIFHNTERDRKTAMEDVLKQLYHVEYSGRKATLNAMAGALKLSDKKLVSLIEEMSALNLIRAQADTISLTRAGKDYALHIIRVHRLWEKYLSERTGIDKSEWHNRAEQMEHTMTSEEAEELYHELGSPRFDPHGDPIPMKTGEIIESNAIPLSGIRENALVKIVHIEDEPEVIYEQIIDKKLHMGQQLKVTDIDDHRVRFFSEGQEYELSSIVASNIGVRKLSEEEVFESGKVRLSSLRQGEKGQVIGISSECRGANRRRLLDLGFIKGTEIETGLESPMKEPKAYLIRNTLIALRNDQADLILIEKTK